MWFLFIYPKARKVSERQTHKDRREGERAVKILYELPDNETTGFVS